MTVTSASMAMPPAAINAALQQQAQQSPAATGQAVTSCTNGRYTGEPINLNVKDVDLKDFFRLLHDISGLNVVLDPSVKGTLTIVLDDVPWDQALAIVLGNNGLECQLQGNVLRIATLETLKTEAEARRAQQDAQALAVAKQSFTRYLSYAHAKDVAPILKKFLSSRGDVVADERSNALIIDDIPDRQPKIDALLTALDRKTPQVEIEARVVSTTRNFIRDIGTQLGFGWGGRNFASGGGTGIVGPITATPGTGFLPEWLTAPGDVNKIPLFSNLPATAPTGGLSLINLTTNYRLDFILTMAENRGLAKVLSRPRVITQNNIKALIRQGTRIPVVTLAQLGGPPTVQYIDAFLRLQVTPQITADNTIFLDVDVENTTPDFTRVSGAQVNPTLNTSQSTTQVLVKDGETVVIGGVIQTQNNIAISQIPLLGSIPILGNLFKHTTINTATQELVFFITPKIIQT
jgi:type IV pilus assembly protein PilQ